MPALIANGVTYCHCGLLATRKPGPVGRQAPAAALPSKVAKFR